jgi:hypothetical protein
MKSRAIGRIIPPGTKTFLTAAVDQPVMDVFIIVWAADSAVSGLRGSARVAVPFLETAPFVHRDFLVSLCFSPKNRFSFNSLKDSHARSDC